MLRKVWRSNINKRIFESIKKTSWSALLLLAIFQLNQIDNTNSLFNDVGSSTDNTFSAGYWVGPEISVESPALGDEWQIGAVEQIEWTATPSDPGATVDEIILEYSCDGGAYQNIDTLSSDPGTYDWTIPEIVSDDCKVKITATDSNNLSDYEESDIFEIGWLVVLNEFIPNPVGADNASMTGGEWVELYNKGNLDVDVAGWVLYDADDSHELYITNSNTDTGDTVVGAGDFLVVYRDGDGDFSLNNGGDEIRLFDGYPVSSSILIDSYTYEGSDFDDLSGTVSSANVDDSSGSPKTSIPEGKSFIRFPDGADNWIDPVPTPGKKNKPDNELEDFQDYYREICFEDGEPVCELDFLESIDLIEREDQEISLEDYAEMIGIELPEIKDDNEDEDGEEKEEKKKEEDFQEYYREVCFEDRDPICELDFLESIDLIEKEDQEIGLEEYAEMIGDELVEIKNDDGDQEGEDDEEGLEEEPDDQEEAVDLEERKVGQSPGIDEIVEGGEAKETSSENETGSGIEEVEEAISKEDLTEEELENEKDQVIENEEEPESEQFQEEEESEEAESDEELKGEDQSEEELEELSDEKEDSDEENDESDEEKEEKEEKEKEEDEI